jgi:hypothetical protein
MGAPENQFWKLAPKSGRKLIYQMEEELEADCMEYFEVTSKRTNWNKQNWVGKDGNEVTVNVTPPFTKKGLCIFLGINHETFDNYGDRKEFSAIVTRVEDIIFNQKFEGATTGHYNSSIIARDLGLVDKKEQNIVTEQPLFGDKLHDSKNE